VDDNGGANPNSNPLCRAAIVNDFDRARRRLSMISLQNRIFPKLLDDSELAGSFQSGPGARSLKVQASADPSGISPVLGVGGRFCARRSDFKGLGSFFCNSNRSPGRAECVSNVLRYLCKYMKVRSKTKSGKAKNATGRTTSSSQARCGLQLRAYKPRQN
jgi:hypothetical protein